MSQADVRNYRGYLHSYYWEFVEFVYPAFVLNFVSILLRLHSVISLGAISGSLDLIFTVSFAGGQFCNKPNTL